MANNLVKSINKDNAMSKDGAQKLVSSIHEQMAMISKGYLAVAPAVAKLYRCKGFLSLGYKNIDDLCKYEFGMSHGTVVGIKKVFDRFGAVSEDNTYTIPERYAEFGYTKLLFFCEDASRFEEANIIPIDFFTPEMSIRKMREKLEETLKLKAKEQDENAIDTKGEFSEGESSEGESSEGESSEGESSEGNKVDSIALIDTMIKDCTILNDMLSNMRPEKKCLIDAINANLKELKKEAKKLN